MSFIYNFILFIILISAIYEFNQNKYVEKSWFFPIIVLMAIVAGLAYAISPDWIPYWNAFEGAATVSWSELGDLSERMDMEIGYIYLNKIVSALGLGYASFLLIFVAISLYLKSVTIYEYGGFVFLSLLLYITPAYFVEEHVHIRQGMANAITLYSIRYIINRKMYAFLICIAIAFLFHKSCIAFILAYWVVKIKFKPVTILIFIASSLLVNFSGLSNVINAVMEIMPLGIGETYNDYANESVESSWTGEVVKIIIVTTILIFNNKATENDPYFPYFRNLYLVGVFMYFFFGGGIFAVRLPNYYLITVIFLIPRMVIAVRENLNYKNIIFIGFTLYALALYVHFYNNWGHKTGFGNYQTSLNKWVPYDFFQKSYPNINE